MSPAMAGGGAFGELEHVGPLRVLGALAAFLRWQSAVGSTSFSNRLRNASRAGRVRALRSGVRAHEISAAIRALMSLVTSPQLPSRTPLCSYSSLALSPRHGSGTL